MTDEAVKKMESHYRGDSLEAPIANAYGKDAAGLVDQFGIPLELADRLALPEELKSYLDGYAAAAADSFNPVYSEDPSANKSKAFYMTHGAAPEPAPAAEAEAEAEEAEEATEAEAEAAEATEAEPEPEQKK
jgi:hypothetical protein